MSFWLESSSVRHHILTISVTGIYVDIPAQFQGLRGDASDVFGPTAARYSMLLTIDLIAFIAGIKTQDSSKESLRRLKHQFVAHIEPDPTRPMSD